MTQFSLVTGFFEGSRENILHIFRAKREVYSVLIAGALSNNSKKSLPYSLLHRLALLRKRNIDLSEFRYKRNISNIQDGMPFCQTRCNPPWLAVCKRNTPRQFSVKMTSKQKKIKAFIFNIMIDEFFIFLIKDVSELD